MGPSAVGGRGSICQSTNGPSGKHRAHFSSGNKRNSNCGLWQLPANIHTKTSASELYMKSLNEAQRTLTGREPAALAGLPVDWWLVLGHYCQTALGLSGLHRGLSVRPLVILSFSLFSCKTWVIIVSTS